jgi:murein DD-endopeptidase MepM/ murein hydrolase activator NlpD
MPGEVIDAGPASGFGQWVRVEHDGGLITVYGHVATFTVSTGDNVAAGDQIATMGNEGQSTGPHLHFEVHQDGTPIDPLPWLNSFGINV